MFFTQKKKKNCHLSNLHYTMKIRIVWILNFKWFSIDFLIKLHITHCVFDNETCMWREKVQNINLIKHYNLGTIRLKLIFYTFRLKIANQCILSDTSTNIKLHNIRVHNMRTIDRFLIFVSRQINEFPCENRNNFYNFCFIITLRNGFIIIILFKNLSL